MRFKKGVREMKILNDEEILKELDRIIQLCYFSEDKEEVLEKLENLYKEVKNAKSC